jgi:hypothetical protein
MRQINIRFTVQKFSNFSYMFYFAFINFYTFTSLFLKKKKKELFLYSLHFIHMHLKSRKVIFMPKIMHHKNSRYEKSLYAFFFFVPNKEKIRKKRNNILTWKMIQKMGYGFELKTIRMITKGTKNLKTEEIEIEIIEATCAE